MTKINKEMFDYALDAISDFISNMDSWEYWDGQDDYEFDDGEFRENVSLAIGTIQKWIRKETRID